MSQGRPVTLAGDLPHSSLLLERELDLRLDHAAGEGVDLILDIHLKLLRAQPAVAGEVLVL